MNKKILLINDYADASIVPEIVARAGYSVDIAVNSDVFSDEIDGSKYDLILLIENPEYNSWIACESIRRSTDIPLIVISPNASPETCAKAINAGADYFIRKPFGPLELVARINSLLQCTSVRQPLPLAPSF